MNDTRRPWEDPAKDEFFSVDEDAPNRGIDSSMNRGIDSRTKIICEQSMSSTRENSQPSLVDVDIYLFIFYSAKLGS